MTTTSTTKKTPLRTPVTTMLTRTPTIKTTATATPTLTIVLLFWLSPPVCWAGSYQGDETAAPDFDFEKEAFVAHSLKINVKATTEECVYQKGDKN